MMDFVIQVVGWAGALLFLISYGLLSVGRLDGRSTTYHLMNIGGAAGFVVNSGWNGALPSATLSIIWMGFGLFALTRKCRAR